MPIDETVIKNQLETGTPYFDPESSTGMNYQTRSITQSNYNIYLSKELNKTIDQFRKEIEKYEKKNDEYSKIILGLSIVMALLALIQIIPIVSPYIPK